MGARRSQSQSVEIALARTMVSGHVEANVSALGEAPSPLAVGEVFGDRYVIEEHISSGGFGAVYRASDKQIRNHQVALKLLHTPAADEVARQHAMRELTLIASVSHPSVVQFKDYGWHEGRLWFAMPWYKGETLDQRYAMKLMTRAEARKIFERLAVGLAAMHEVGIEHHDIKPENIFLADIAGFDGGLPVLLDLGIAGVHGEGPRGLTLDYAAPETARQALGDDVQVDGAADVFSLALVLRNMIEPAEIPDGEFSPLALLHQRATEPVEGFRHRGLRFMQPAMLRWLNPDPTQRPTATEFYDELAILTQPEERRAARVRLLKRLVPVLLVTGLLVSFLWMQVRERETQIDQQREKLTEQKQQTASLRERSQTQLGKLESQMAEIGTQRRELTRAISIAREIDKQLEQTEEQRAQLSRRARTLGAERDGLRTELAELEAQRDALQRRHDGLSAERDALQRRHDGLAAERDGLVLERDKLKGQRAELEEAVAAAHSAATLNRERLQQAEAERDRANDKVELLKSDVAAMRNERASLDVERRRLEKKLAALEQLKAELEEDLRNARRVQAAAQKLEPGEVRRTPKPRTLP